METENTSRGFQPILLNGLDPRHEFVHDVSGCAPQLPAPSLRDDHSRDHIAKVAPSGLHVNPHVRTGRLAEAKPQACPSSHNGCGLKK